MSANTGNPTKYIKLNFLQNVSVCMSFYQLEVTAVIFSCLL